MWSLELLKELCKSNEDVRNDITKGLHYIYSGLGKYNKVISEDVMGNIEAQNFKASLNQVQLQITEVLMQDISLDELVLEDFNKINPAQITLKNQTLEVNDWSDILMYVCELLVQIHHDEFINYINQEYINRHSSVFLKEATFATAQIDETDFYLSLALPKNKIRAVFANLVQQFNVDQLTLNIKVIK